MPRVFFLLPDTDVVVADNLEPGHALLVGRNPSQARLDPSAIPPGLTHLRAVAVSSPIVSENHLLAWQDGPSVLLLDLHSKNGSAAALPGGQPVAFPGVSPLLVSLSKPRNARRDDAPRDADWSTKQAYPHAVAHEIVEWLAQRGLDVAAELRATPATERPGPIAPIPIAGDLYLHLVDNLAGAQTVGLTNVAEALFRYVGEQEARLWTEQLHEGTFIQASAGFRRAHREIVEAAARGVRVVLQGETGSGRGRLAQCYALHASVKRASFVAVNCARLDRTSSYIELFGARKGAAPDGRGDVKSALERADGGVLFLAEVSELGPEAQAMLLHFLDKGRYARLGDDRERGANVRVICGSSVDLRRAAEGGAFRYDLWQRLAVRVISVPPLRERPEDIEAYLRLSSLGQAPRACSVYEALHPEAVAFLAQRYGWPGNFRELEALVKRLPPDARRHAISAAVCRSAIDTARIEELRQEDTTPPAPSRAPQRGAAAEHAALYATALEVLRRMTGSDSVETVAQLEALHESIYMPLYFARRLGLEHIDAVPRNPVPSYRAMGELLDCTDDTVKKQLARYVAMKPYLAGAPHGERA